MNLAPDVEALLQQQVTRERYAAGVYTALGAWANTQAFPGLEAWATASAAEEGTHAAKFVAYLNTRSQARLDAVPAPPQDFGDYGQALAGALALEQSVTAAIGAIGAAALGAGDWLTLALAQEFLAEQAQAEHEITVYLTRVQRGAPVDLLDAELYEGSEG